MQYNLSSLLKLREHHKNVAEQELKKAIYQQETEEVRLKNLKKSLFENKNARVEMHNQFFNKTRTCDQASDKFYFLVGCDQKNLRNELELKKLLEQQKKRLHDAQLKRQHASKSAVVAKQNYQAICMHHERFKKKMHHLAQQKIDNENDDQNCVRFIKNQRA